jgi:Tfp pilus assembly protein PilF
LCRQSIEIEPLSASAYLALARAYLVSADLKNARETLDRLLKLDPGNDAAREARLRLQTTQTEKP